MARRLREVDALVDIFEETSEENCDDVLKTWSKKELQDFADAFDVCYGANDPMALIREAIVADQRRIRRELKETQEDGSSPERDSRARLVNADLGPPSESGKEATRVREGVRNAVGSGTEGSRCAPATVGGVDIAEQEILEDLVEKQALQEAREEVKEQVRKVVPDVDHVKGSVRFEMDCWVKVLREGKMALLLNDKGLMTPDDWRESVQKMFDLGSRRFLKLFIAYKEGWGVAKMIPDLGDGESLLDGKESRLLAKNARKEAFGYRSRKASYEAREWQRFHPYSARGEGEQSNKQSVNPNIVCWSCKQKGHPMKNCPALKGAAQGRGK